MVAKNQGMVLLMVLAVLTLLCLLGLMFVLMANMERATARAYLDMVRAKMVAQSGVHAAMTNTRVLLTEEGFDFKSTISFCCRRSFPIASCFLIMVGFSCLDLSFYTIPFLILKTNRALYTCPSVLIYKADRRSITVKSQEQT